MSKVLVLYYSSYGHIEVMANAVAEEARQAGAQVDINGASPFGFEGQVKSHGMARSVISLEKSPSELKSPAMSPWIALTLSVPLLPPPEHPGRFPLTHST